MRIEQSHGAKLYTRWIGPYYLRDIAQSLETPQLAEPDVVQVVGWIYDSRLRMFYTCNKGVNHAP